MDRRIGGRLYRNNNRNAMFMFDLINVAVVKSFVIKPTVKRINGYRFSLTGKSKSKWHEVEPRFAQVHWLAVFMFTVAENYAFCA